MTNEATPESPFDPVEEASEESFPASDPPSWTLGEETHSPVLAVSNNESKSRFETHVDSRTAFLDYIRSPGEIALTHAETPRELERRGIASAITRAALEYARQHGLKVVPLCPFTIWYLQQHPEDHDLVRPDHRTRLSGR